MSTINNFNEMLFFINHIEKNNLSFDQTIKMRFLRNFTIEPIEIFLKFYLYKLDIKAIITYSDYDGILQEILDLNSHLYTEKPEIIVLSLFDDPNSKDNQEATQHNLKNLYLQLAEKTNAFILMNTVIPPFYSFISSFSEEITLLNSFIRDWASQNTRRFVLLDWEKYIRTLGESASIDYRYWYLNKAPFKKDFLNYYAREISQVIAAIKGKAKKCLILDCDNTLWGGIIGEEGINGIKLDDYNHPGKIFYDFQRFILTLYQRGIILALCSKNNEEEVWQVFENHPACLIKRVHIAAHRINWEDKATNIAELASELNVSLDSFVFIDDNAAECDLVKNMLPEVTVLQVPKDLCTYPQFLLKEAIFSFLSVNIDDEKRTVRYQQEKNRKQFQTKFDNIEDYFCALDLSVDIHLLRETEIARVAQLTQKTNQFNFSLMRFTEAEINFFYRSGTKKIFTISAKDRYGDYGLTGVLAAKQIDAAVQIDLMLLSCRVLSRRIEYAFISYCLKYLYDEFNLNRCIITFFPTKKNTQIKTFLDSIGSIFKEEKNGFHIYELNGAPKTPKIDFIKVKLENGINEYCN